MAQTLRDFDPGTYYHVIAQGNEDRAVFESQRDREVFLGYCSSATERYGAIIHCYCLMDDHYHLLLETPEGNLSQIMRHINGAYTTYCNTQCQRFGPVFQERFRAIPVEADSCAGELSRYLHLNPVRARLVERPENYIWSSYRSYVGLSTAAEWLKTGFILDDFGREGATDANYRSYVEELLDRDYERPLPGRPELEICLPLVNPDYL